MRRLFLSIIIIAYTIVSNAQSIPYPSYSLDNISKYEKVLFDKYDIDYAGGWTRFLCVSGYVNKLDPKTQISVKREYAAFQKFNKNYFQQVPTKTPLFDMEFYLIGKKIESEFLNLVLRNSNNKVVGIYEKQVNDSDFNIKTIVILEIYSEDGVSAESDAIDHMILIKDFSDNYRVLSPADEFVNFGNIDCLDCPAEF